MPEEGDRQPGEAGEDAEGERAQQGGEGEQDEGEQVAEGSEGEGEQAGAEGETPQDSEGQSGTEPGEQGDAGGEQPQPPEASGFDEGQDPFGDSGQQDPNASPDDGGNGDGAGDLASEERPGEQGEGQAAGDPEFLEGLLGLGPETPAGTIRLPGATEVELPPGRSAGEYTRAVERAVTEGSIPVDYQEIIRNYFR